MLSPLENLRVCFYPDGKKSGLAEKRQKPIDRCLKSINDKLRLLEQPEAIHLPLPENPVSLSTPNLDMRPIFDPMHFDKEGYFSFHPIPGRESPIPEHPFGGNYISFQDKEGDDNITVIVIDARFPAPNSQRDVTFFQLQFQKVLTLTTCINHLEGGLAWHLSFLIIG